jgi:hypothetical protein
MSILNSMAARIARTFVREMTTGVANSKLNTELQSNARTYLDDKLQKLSRSPDASSTGSLSTNTSSISLPNLSSPTPLFKNAVNNHNAPTLSSIAATVMIGQKLANITREQSKD